MSSHFAVPERDGVFFVEAISGPLHGYQHSKTHDTRFIQELKSRVADASDETSKVNQCVSRVNMDEVG